MAENGSNGGNGNGERFDSWKAIAAYLNRDERTVRRWERKGLPVRRVPGGNRGQSVFAFKSEIDHWLTLPRDEPAELETPASPVPDTSSAPARPRWPIIGLAATAAVAIVLTVVAVIWRDRDEPLSVSLTPTAVVAADADGEERWRYTFGTDTRVEPPQERQQNPTEPLPDAAAVLVGTGLRVTRDEGVESGELLRVGNRGDLQRRFAFEDALTFDAGQPYVDPWGITDFRVDDPQAAGRIAVAAHHYEWWPSMIAVLDPLFQRRGTFVHAGWLERVHWLSQQQLLVAGFSEPRQGGVVALLDPNRLDGQSPEDPGSRFFCSACGEGRPLRYVVMPRSEVNRASGSRFNRARLQIVGDRITVRTIEVPSGETAAADAVYEFGGKLEILGASFSDRYWEVHAALEAQGRLDHGREQCPDRNGPREVLVWEPATGWQTISIN